jgi:hypothetical protein
VAAKADGGDGWLAACQVEMDELVMVERRGGDVVDNVDDGEAERHNLLRIRIVRLSLTTS